MRTEVAIRKSEHQPVADSIQTRCSATLRNTRSRSRTEHRKAGGRRTGKHVKCRIARGGKVCMEVEELITARTRPFDESCRRAGRWQVRAVEIRRQEILLQRSASDTRRDEAGRKA